MGLIDKDPSEQSNPYLKIIFGVALGVGLTLLFSQIWNYEYGPQDKPRDYTTSSSEGPGLTAPPSPYQDPIGREERALAVSKLESFREQANSVLAALNVLEKEIARWEVDIEPLKLNSDGRWIAADEALVRFFQKNITEERMSSIAVSSIRTQVDEMLTPVIQAIKDPTELYVPSLALSKALTKLHSDVYYGAKKYQKLRSQILAMVEDAKVATGEPAPISLQTAIARLEGERTRRRAELVAIEEQKVEEEVAQRLAAIRKQTLEKEAASEEKILLERQRNAEQMAELERKKLEDQRYRAMSKDANVQKQFAPFLAPGRYVLNSDTKFQYGNSDSVPYDELVRINVFNILDNFVAAGTSSSHNGRLRSGHIYRWQNDRPLWKSPHSKEEWDAMREKWELFKNLTPYWLESGVLKKYQR